MNSKTVTNLTVIAGVISMLCLGAYYLALHDILRDYVSAGVLQQHAPGFIRLPDWTACAPEWKVVRIGFWPMLAFHALFLAGKIPRLHRAKDETATRSA